MENAEEILRNRLHFAKVPHVTTLYTVSDIVAALRIDTTKGIILCVVPNEDDAEMILSELAVHTTGIVDLRTWSCTLQDQYIRLIPEKNLLNAICGVKAVAGYYLKVRD